MPLWIQTFIYWGVIIGVIRLVAYLMEKRNG